MRSKKIRSFKTIMLAILQKKVNQLSLIVVVIFLLIIPLWSLYNSIDPINGGQACPNAVLLISFIEFITITGFFT
jgi:hypothetical protein